ncbi:MAG: acetyl-CoA hydrolase/transferase C-terminal domain-containing protein [Pseudomonadota bacterium]
MPQGFDRADHCVDELLRRAGRPLVVALPIGLGKPVPLVNELYRRAVADPSLQLTLLTGLTLALPRATGDLERRFLEPFVARVFGDCPEPDYIDALRRNALPPNVRIIEFFFSPGLALDWPQSQQNYLAANYTQVTRELLQRGVNVVLQLIATRTRQGELQYSLGANPDITVELLAQLRQRGQPCVVVGQVHSQLPFMLGDAQVPANTFDLLLQHPRYDHKLYCPPNLPLNAVDHAIGLWCSALLKDGGTLQIGIGELGDAVCHSTLLRHQRNDQWRRTIQQLALPDTGQLLQKVGGDQPFSSGLFACSEMFVDQLLDLYRAGVLRRRILPDGVVLQAAFLLGPQKFYSALRDLPDEELALFEMCAVGRVNALGETDRELRRQQRCHARFINTSMMMTLLGAAVSDALEDGRVVSGVGGQLNFVMQSMDLPDARSILCLRATREKRGVLQSNIRYAYGHATVPRYLRDIVVTEYGCADLRGKTDAEIIAALLGIADSRFQPQLLAEAQRHGKLPRDYRLPDAVKNNTSQRVAEGLRSVPDLFPEYPFGTDFTDEEIDLSRALKLLGQLTATRRGGLVTVLRALATPLNPDHQAALARMGLAAPRGFKERLQRRTLGLGLGLALGTDPRR